MRIDQRQKDERGATSKRIARRESLRRAGWEILCHGDARMGIATLSKSPEKSTAYSNLTHIFGLPSSSLKQNICSGSLLFSLRRHISGSSMSTILRSALTPALNQQESALGTSHLRQHQLTAQSPQCRSTPLSSSVTILHLPYGSGHHPTGVHHLHRRLRHYPSNLAESAKGFADSDTTFPP
jgi:hypothetical protein